MLAADADLRGGLLDNKVHIAYGTSPYSKAPEALHSLSGAFTCIQGSREVPLQCLAVHCGPSLIANGKWTLEARAKTRWLPMDLC